MPDRVLFRVSKSWRKIYLKFFYNCFVIVFVGSRMCFLYLGQLHIHVRLTTASHKLESFHQSTHFLTAIRIIKFVQQLKFVFFFTKTKSHDLKQNKSKSAKLIFNNYSIFLNRRLRKLSLRALAGIGRKTLVSPT